MLNILKTLRKIKTPREIQPNDGKTVCNMPSSVRTKKIVLLNARLADPLILRDFMNLKSKIGFLLQVLILQSIVKIPVGKGLQEALSLRNLIA